MAELVIGLLIVGVLLFYLAAFWDDLVFDAAYLLRFRGLKGKELTPAELDTDRSRRIAVLLPVWQEAQTVGPMIRATLGYTNYSPLHVDIFVGVHPNDRETVEAVEALSQEFVNVHIVVGERPGPARREQLLNFMYGHLERFERNNRLTFDAVALHTVHDVIHPYTFKLYSALLARHAAVQLPVLALPRAGGFWGRLLGAGYAGDFAEEQHRQLPVREALGFFIPNAPAGFAVRRELLLSMAVNGKVFNERADAAEYDLALRLWQKGYPVHFHVQPVRRLEDGGQLRREVISIRQHFPDATSAVMRRKGHWTHGLGRQILRVLRDEPLSEDARLLQGRQRAETLAHLAHLVGFPVFVYALLALLFGLPGGGSPAVLGLVALTGAALIARGSMRHSAVRALYGREEARLASLLPPGFPLRWVLMGLLNPLRRKPGARPAEAKAAYAGEALLEAGRLRLGDQLLFYNDIAPGYLAQAMQMQGFGVQRPRLGEILVAENLITEQTLRKRLAELRWTRMAATVNRQTQALGPTFHPRDLHRRKAAEASQDKNPTVLTDTMF